MSTENLKQLSSRLEAVVKIGRESETEKKGREKNKANLY